MEIIPLKWFAVLSLPILLAAYYISVTSASPNSKIIVAVLFGLSFATFFLIPAYWLGGFLLQVAIGIYIAFYLIFEKQ